MIHKAMPLVLIGLLLASSVSASKVRYKGDPETDYSVLKTYSWRETGVSVDAVVTRNIRAGADEGLAKNGLREVDSTTEKPDVWVEFYVGSVDSLHSAVRAQMAPGWWGGLYILPGANSAIEAGILVVLTNSETEKIVWAGSVVMRGNNPQALQVMVQRAEKETRKVMKKYPRLE